MRGVRKAFGGTVALDGVDFAVRAGEVCALVGQNGAGKSTLMSVLAGATAPDAGTMMLAGAPYAPRSPRDARNAGVAMIYQELSLAPHLSVMDNIALGAEPRRPKIRLRASISAPGSASRRTTSAMLLPSVTLTEQLYQRSGDESTGGGSSRASERRRSPASAAAPARALP